MLPGVWAGRRGDGGGGGAATSTDHDTGDWQAWGGRADQHGREGGGGGGLPACAYVTGIAFATPQRCPVRGVACRGHTGEAARGHAEVAAKELHRSALQL